MAAQLAHKWRRRWAERKVEKALERGRLHFIWRTGATFWGFVLCDWLDGWTYMSVLDDAMMRKGEKRTREAGGCGSSMLVTLGWVGCMVCRMCARVGAGLGSAMLTGSEHHQRCCVHTHVLY
jgi:hypothetical protein